MVKGNSYFELTIFILETVPFTITNNYHVLHIKDRIRTLKYPNSLNTLYGAILLCLKMYLLWVNIRSLNCVLCSFTRTTFFFTFLDKQLNINSMEFIQGEIWLFNKKNQLRPGNRGTLDFKLYWYQMLNKLLSYL